MCLRTIRMIWICYRLYKFVSNKMNALERHIHSKLSCVTSVERAYTFSFIYKFYAADNISIRRIIHLQPLFNHCNKDNDNN